MKKFKESLNVAVYTTKFVIEQKSPIVYVSHDQDGSWQFHGPENNVDDDDIRLVALGEVIEIDNSVLSLADMSKGFEASRDSKNSKWEIIGCN